MLSGEFNARPIAALDYLKSRNLRAREMQFNMELLDRLCYLLYRGCDVLSKQCHGALGSHACDRQPTRSIDGSREWVRLGLGL